jgi:hypothetical protein
LGRFEFLERGAGSLNLPHVLFRVLGEYTEQIQKRYGSALAVLAGAREYFCGQIF